MYYEMHGARLPWILREFDRASMAHGVEVRAPFLDWRLVTYAFSLPIESKIRDGYAKFILREALSGIVPDSVRLRKKKLGFPIAIYRWLEGPLKDYALDIAGSEAFQQQEIWDGPRVRKVVERAIAEKNRRAIKIAWGFIHAARLASLFSEHAAANRKIVAASPTAAVAS